MLISDDYSSNTVLVTPNAEKIQISITRLHKFHNKSHIINEIKDIEEENQNFEDEFFMIFY